MAKVYIKFNSAVIKEVPLDKEEVTFGRKPTNDIVIDHPTISGFHGRLKKDGDHYVVEDLNSTNGTFINGRRVKSGSLKDNDQVGVAGHILDFHTDNAASASGEVAHAPSPKVNQLDPIPTSSIEKQKEIFKMGLGITAEGKPLPPMDDSLIEGKASAVAVVRIIAGNVNGQTEVQLKDLVTYIGTTDQALIKIKGFLVPSLAAAISKRPDGYFLKAVKAGYPKVNGNAIQEQVLLENGALIEVGGTNMVFYRGDQKKAVA